MRWTRTYFRLLFTLLVLVMCFTLATTFRRMQTAETAFVELQNLGAEISDLRTAPRVFFPSGLCDCEVLTKRSLPHLGALPRLRTLDLTGVTVHVDLLETAIKRNVADVVLVTNGLVVDAKGKSVVTKERPGLVIVAPQVPRE